MRPLISVCIPNYNYEKFIAETINSVLSQTYDNYEIIICDNCSTDKSIDIINSFSDYRIRLYKNKENINLYENINKALSLSHGELVAVLHSDDFWDSRFLEKVVEAYNEYPAERVFVTGVYNYHSEVKRALSHHPYESAGIKSNIEVMLQLQDKNNIGNGCNVVIHRDCIGQAGMYSSNYKFASDYDLWLRLAEYFNVVYINELLAYYRIHDSNLSHKVTKNLEMIKEGYEIYKTNMKKSNVIPVEFMPEIERISCATLFQKSWKMGIKYRSGKLIREMLDCSIYKMPSLKKDIYFYLMKFLSYFMPENMPELYFLPFKTLFRGILLPKKLWTENSRKKLLEKSKKGFNLNDDNIYQMQ